tara:strand:- start:344 stop:625 length:282 start_codon:yes stop_codon:yes gene_type:complete
MLNIYKKRLCDDILNIDNQLIIMCVYNSMSIDWNEINLLNIKTTKDLQIFLELRYNKYGMEILDEYNENILNYENIKYKKYPNRLFLRIYTNE